MKKLLLALLPALLVVIGCDTATPTKPPTPTPGPSGDAGPAPAIIGTGAKVTLSPDNMSIKFVGSKPERKHNGDFKKFSGTIQVVAMQPGGKTISRVGSVMVEIETDSLSADDPKLTTHLKSNDFFDVAKFPKATFESTKVEFISGKEADEEIKITGDLTLHGVKKSITIPAKVLSEKGLSLSATFELSRKEFGMTYEPAKVDDKVTVEVTLGKWKK